MTQLTLPEVLMPDAVLCDACEARERARIVTIIADSCGRMKVHSVWYERDVIQTGHASARIATSDGEWYRGLGPIGPESLEEARRIAARLGVELVVAHSLREVVEDWKEKSDG